MNIKLIIYYILVLLGLLFSLYNVSIEYRWGEKIAADDNGVIADAIWEIPSLCTYNTGIFLAKCTSKADIKPIEDIGCGDLGYPLIANIITFLNIKKTPLNKADLVKFNIWLNWAGLIFLAIALIIIGLRWAALLTIFAGSYHFINREELFANYYSTFFGVFCIVLGGLMFFVLALKSKTNSVSRTIFLFIAFISLAVALLIREPLGYIGLINVLFIVLTNFIREKTKWSIKILKYGVMSLMIYSITLLPLALINLRSLIWDVPKGKIMPSHGISYTLIIGFGTIPNSWGITRSDETARAIAKNINPDVVFNSRKHFDILRKVYVRMILDKPLELLHIYWLMIQRVLSSSTKLLSYNIYIFLLLILIGIFFLFLKNQFNVISHAVLFLGTSTLFALTQGFLSGVYYAKTSEIGFIVTILALLEINIQTIRNKCRAFHGFKRLIY